MSELAGLREDQIDAFVEVMVKKLSMFYFDNENPEVRLRVQVKQIVVDTLLLASGDVPLERWLEDG